MFKKDYDKNVIKTNDKEYNDYIRYSKCKNGSVMFKYVFEYSHKEDDGSKHIKSQEKPEYIRHRKDGSILVFYENLEKRERIVLDENKIDKPGRKFGSKDTIQRTRRKKDDVK